MDYEGQRLAELLFYYIILGCGGFGWVIGYFQQDFTPVFQCWLVGVVISVVVSFKRLDFTPYLFVRPTHASLRCWHTSKSITIDLTSAPSPLSLFASANSCTALPRCGLLNKSNISLTFIQFTQQTNNSYAFQIGHSTISIQWNGLTQYQIEEGRNKPWFMMETLFCSRWDMHCFRQSIAFQCFGINTTLDEIQNSMLYIHVCDKGKLYYLTVSCISRVVSWSVIFVMNWRYVILPRL